MSIIPWDKVDPNESPFVRLFSLIGIPFAAGLINFVVLTAAASSCNSGIFSNSRMLFGLSEQKQAPSIFKSTNKQGVPHIAIIVSSALLLVTALLNYIFPNATLVFTYVTTISTVLFIIVWALIIWAYINYHRKILNYIKSKIQTSWWKIYGLYYFSILLICVLFTICKCNNKKRYFLNTYLVYYFRYYVFKI